MSILDIDVDDYDISWIQLTIDLQESLCKSINAKLCNEFLKIVE